MDQNAFISLCGIAGREHWCWNMLCTTCGHTDFLYGLMQIDRGSHPQDGNWVSRKEFQSRERPLGDYSVPRRHLEGGCERLYLTCASASIIELSKVCPFPDYLGYLGIVLHHLEHIESRYLLLTKLWKTELIGMCRDEDAEPARTLGSPVRSAEQLRWMDLERFESGINWNFRLTSEQIQHD